jgi:hypothetical protein
MTPEDREHFENVLVKAIQSTKQENSGLVDTIMHKMEKGIEESINRNVNGKIKRIDEKLDAYIMSDNEWKEKYSPMLEAFTSISTSGKLILKLAVGVGSFLLAITAIKDYFK